MRLKNNVGILMKSTLAYAKTFEDGVNWGCPQKKSVSCPAGGQNCGQSGGRIPPPPFFFPDWKILSIFAEKKSLQTHLFLVNRPLNRKHNYFYGQPGGPLILLACSTAFTWPKYLNASSILVFCLKLKNFPLAMYFLSYAIYKVFNRTVLFSQYVS